MGRDENAGFNAFVPLIDSDISRYAWTGPRFVSAVLYTRKGFAENAAIDFTRDDCDMRDDPVCAAF